jgi:hypothetical protein
MLQQKLALLCTALVLVFGAVNTALADSSGGSQTVGNVVLYLGILPAPMILGHPPGHPEMSMHGGRPRGADEYHVIVALFDASDGKRITHAKVSARVSEIGLAGQEKKLEPMEIARTVTYGNYFKMEGSGPFRISLDIRGPGEADQTTAVFEQASMNRITFGDGHQRCCDVDLSLIAHRL